MADNSTQNSEITLAPDAYLYLTNVGKGGLMTVHCGPSIVNQTGQDQPNRYNPNTRSFEQCALRDAVQQCPRANEGDYVILENPAVDETCPHPISTQQQAAALNKGRKVIMPGPWSNALWPGQSATVIPGHRLRSNQYVIAIVYNADEAEKNWSKSTVAVADQTPDDQKKVKKGLPTPETFAVGTRIVVRGCDVSFFIPCTGVEVLKDDNGKYIREAVTLGQMEYCCLVDENGKKEYPRGPKVVFPLPTQVFERDANGCVKFSPIELNPINGLHLKVTADFEDEDIEKPAGKDGKRPMRKYTEGTELFVTGKTLSIYYPREQLAIIEYGDQKRHYSTVIPKGEGRYVLQRETGDIKLTSGPKTFLADPRYEILIRRALSPEECELWYPGNAAAKAYNAELAGVIAQASSGRSGLVSEGDYKKSLRSLADSSQSVSSGFAYTSSLHAMDAIEAFDPSAQKVGEAIGAKITRTPRTAGPRQMVLNTKFDGVPKIVVWPGYAILIVGAEGSRRVVQGPETILLEYDECLGFMELSTGKPKTTDRLMKTAYLCTTNNQVSDIVPFESKDHVKGTIKISMRVNFDAKTPEDRLKWFSVDNYVKYLADHVRSIIAGMSKKYTVAEIKADYVNLVRDAILGPKNETTGERTGLVFSDNLMRVFEVEVLNIALTDTEIERMLNQAQYDVVSTNIALDNARRKLEATIETERITKETAVVTQTTQREIAAITAETDLQKLQLQQTLIDGQIALRLKQAEDALKSIEIELSKTVANAKIANTTHADKLDRDRLTAKAQDEQKRLAAKADLDIRNDLIDVAKSELAVEKDRIDATTNAAVQRFNAAKDGLYEVLVSLGRDEMAAKLAEACKLESYLSGDSVGNSIANLLSLAPGLQMFFERATKGQAAIQERLLADTPGKRNS